MAYGHLPLLDGASLQIDEKERVALVGRNGAGKSTLLQLVTGELPPDAGSIWRQPGLRVARLSQDVPLSTDRTVFDVVSEGAGHLDEEWQRDQRVDVVLSRLGLAPDAIVDTLSGGWRRRVLLARALAGEPTLLVLDEPTNHLDIEALTWLEDFLSTYPGAVLFVTHDRVFLERLATRIVELDRGRLTSWPGDYRTFLRKKEDWLANEAVRHEKFDKRLAEEEVWLRQGVKARRTRDEGRVRALLAMRKERSERRAQAGAVRLQAGAAERSGRMVFEAEEIGKAYGDNVVVSDFSVRVMRGDRIGLIGPNGAGKTTLLRLILGELAPDTGTVRHGANVQVAYYDQQREQLDPERTVFETVGDGNDTVTVNGRTQHVHGYLRDFLFSAERANSPVKALSGGERNRLLLARLLTRAANVLVLDEPTNDLDIETLELLEELVSNFPGTVLLVSHDRVFLNRVVTSTLAASRGGRRAARPGAYAAGARAEGSAAQEAVIQGKARARAADGDDPRARAGTTAAAGEDCRGRLLQGAQGRHRADAGPCRRGAGHAPGLDGTLG